MAQQPEDRAVLSHIEKLVEEEHHLRERGSLDAAESKRLSAIEAELDQCWDVLRQRRALRETGRDPGDAHLRPAEVVEKYTG